MHHLWFIGYHTVYCCNIVSLDLYPNTSGKILPMLFLFVDASIYYILIMQSFPKVLWCGIWFTPSIVLVVNSGSFWQCGKHVLWLNGNHLLPHMVSLSHRSPSIGCTQLQWCADAGWRGSDWGWRLRRRRRRWGGYSHRTLSSTNDDWLAVEQNLRRERGKWGRMVNILGREGEDNRMVERLYMTVVQTVLLFGSRDVGTDPPAGEILRGFLQTGVKADSGHGPQTPMGWDMGLPTHLGVAFNGGAECYWGLYCPPQ